MFAHRLRQLLRERDLRQVELARHLPGVAESSISEYVRGETLPGSATLAALSEYFDVSADWLLGLTDVRPRLRSGYYLVSARIYHRTRRLAWRAVTGYQIPDDALVVSPAEAESGPTAGPASANGSS